MAATLRLPEPNSDPDPRFEDPAFVADLYADRLRFTVSWPEVLAMAVRDNAVSVHYHPWRTGPDCDDALSYVVAGIRYGLLPPDVGSGRRLLAAARRLAAPGPFARLWAWAIGGAIGRVRLEAGSGESDWCVVCWGRAPLAGVEFFRLSPVTDAAPLGRADAEPGAAPGRCT